MDALTTKRYRLIDRAIHLGDRDSITIANESLPVNTAKNGLRYITWEDKTFIQQDPQRNTQYGRLAKKKRITRIMRSGGQRWGLMIDGDIELP